MSLTFEENMAAYKKAVDNSIEYLQEVKVLLDEITPESLFDKTDDEIKTMVFVKTLNYTEVVGPGVIVKLIDDLINIRNVYKPIDNQDVYDFVDVKMKENGEKVEFSDIEDPDLNYNYSKINLITEFANEYGVAPDRVSPLIVEYFNDNYLKPMGKNENENDETKASE